MEKINGIAHENVNQIGGIGRTKDWLQVDFRFIYRRDLQWLEVSSKF